MRYAQGVGNLTRVMLVTILHHASATDYLERSNFRQPGQKIILDTVGKRGVFSVVTQIFKRQHRDAGCCWWSTEQLAFPKDHADRRHQGERQCHRHCSSWISLQPFLPAADSSDAPGLDWLVFQPALQVVGKC